MTLHFVSQNTSLTKHFHKPRILVNTMHMLITNDIYINWQESIIEFISQFFRVKCYINDRNQENITRKHNTYEKQSL